MPAIANITINDGAATPVAHVFSPDGQTGNNVSFAERTSGISVGFPRIKLNMTLAEGKQPLNKIRVRFSIPKLETVSGSTVPGFIPAAKLAYLGSFDGTFIFHERALWTERRDLRVELANLFANTLFVQMIDDLAPVY